MSRIVWMSCAALCLVICSILTVSDAYIAGPDPGPSMSILSGLLQNCNPEEACHVRAFFSEAQQTIASSAHDPHNISEDQLRKLCRDARNVSRCRTDYVKTNCLSQVPAGFRDLIETYANAGNDAMKVCESPSLYTDFQILVPCVKKITGLAPPAASELSSAFGGCIFQFMLQASPAISEYERLKNLPTADLKNAVVDRAAVQQGLCCGGKALTDCGAEMLTGVCSSEAVEVAKKYVKVVGDSLKCSEVTAATPCPAAPTFNFPASQNRDSDPGVMS